MEADLVGEQAAERQADRAADAGDGAEQRDAGGDALARELVADDPEGERKTPPPIPCRPRPTIISASESPTAQTTEPTAKRASETAR